MRFLVMILVLIASADATAAERYKGRLVSDALHVLQRAGLRIVFSSEIVTPELRVSAEPRSKVPLEILEEILKPHGLTVERGPDQLLIVVRTAPTRRDQATPATSTRPREVSNVTNSPSYFEQVIVTADELNGANHGSGAGVSLTRDELARASDVLSADPLRALHALPRVMATDDFRSEFSVRGGSQRHVGIVIDGVATPWLRHAAYGRSDLGSLTMLGTDVLEQASLQAGAYPQRNGEWLGAQLTLNVREGSRNQTRVQASLSGINGAVTAEGPLGEQQRGSWLVAARQSYLHWPVKQRNAPDPSVFGFSDALAKVVYDVHTDHKLTIMTLAGRTGIDGPDGGPSWDLANGTNSAGLLSARWDATLSGNVRLSQQFHAVSHRFRNSYQNGQNATHGVESDLSYRVDVSRPAFGGLLEVGGQARSGDYRSVYFNFGWAPARRLTIWPGLRVSTASVASRPAVGRWVLGQWRIRDGWTIDASAGVSHQFPQQRWTAETGSRSRLDPERANHAEMSLAHRLGPSTRWQASVFRRSERDVLAVQHSSLLTGESAGIELLLERRVLNGLSGWVGYSFGKSYYTDRASGETLRADFDRRHSINAFAHYAFSNGTSVGVTFRGGSSFPRLLSPYARLDVKAERGFDVAGHRVTMFGQVINVLNRGTAARPEEVTGQPPREAAGFTERLLPRMPLAGLRIEF